jgi:hypothetical protein
MLEALKRLNGGAIRLPTRDRDGRIRITWRSASNGSGRRYEINAKLLANGADIQACDVAFVVGPASYRGLSCKTHCDHERTDPTKLFQADFVMRVSRPFIRFAGVGGQPERCKSTGMTAETPPMQA